MQPTQELVDAIYREKVLRARRTPMAQKLLDGPQLFDYASRINKSGIRAQHPHLSEIEVDQVFRHRLKLRERLETAP